MANFTSYPDSAGANLKLRVRLLRQLTTGSTPRDTMFTGDFTNIIANHEIVLRLGSAGGNPKYLGGVKILFINMTGDANYADFNNLNVTLRLRRVPTGGTTSRGVA